jgi:hypothetical protein
MVKDKKKKSSTSTPSKSKPLPVLSKLVTSASKLSSPSSLTPTVGSVTTTTTTPATIPEYKQLYDKIYAKLKTDLSIKSTVTGLSDDSVAEKVVYQLLRKISSDASISDIINLSDGYDFYTTKPSTLSPGDIFVQFDIDDKFDIDNLNITQQTGGLLENQIKLLINSSKYNNNWFAFGGGMKDVYAVFKSTTDITKKTNAKDVLAFAKEPKLGELGYAFFSAPFIPPSAKTTTPSGTPVVTPTTPTTTTTTTATTATTTPTPDPLKIDSNMNTFKGVLEGELKNIKDSIDAEITKLTPTTPYDLTTPKKTIEDDNTKLGNLKLDIPVRYNSLDSYDVGKYKTDNGISSEWDDTKKDTIMSDIKTAYTTNITNHTSKINAIITANTKLLLDIDNALKTALSSYQTNTQTITNDFIKTYTDQYDKLNIKSAPTNDTELNTIEKEINDLITDITTNLVDKNTIYTTKLATEKTKLATNPNFFGTPDEIAIDASNNNTITVANLRLISDLNTLKTKQKKYYDDVISKKDVGVAYTELKNKLDTYLLGKSISPAINNDELLVEFNNFIQTTASIPSGTTGIASSTTKLLDIIDLYEKFDFIDALPGPLDNNIYIEIAYDTDATTATYTFTTKNVPSDSTYGGLLKNKLKYIFNTSKYYNNWFAYGGAKGSFIAKFAPTKNLVKLKFAQDLATHITTAVASSLTTTTTTTTTTTPKSLPIMIKKYVPLSSTYSEKALQDLSGTTILYDRTNFKPITNELVVLGKKFYVYNPNSNKYLLVTQPNLDKIYNLSPQPTQIDLYNVDDLILQNDATELGKIDNTKEKKLTFYIDSVYKFIDLYTIKDTNDAERIITKILTPPTTLYICDDATCKAGSTFDISSATSIAAKFDSDADIYLSTTDPSIPPPPPPPPKATVPVVVPPPVPVVVPPPPAPVTSSASVSKPTPKLPDDNKLRVLLTNYMVPNYQVYYDNETFNPYAPQQTRQEFTSAYFERTIDDKLRLLKNSNELRKKYRIDKVLASLEKYEDIIDEYTNRNRYYDRSEGDAKYNYEKAMRKLEKRVNYLNKIINKLNSEKIL